MFCPNCGAKQPDGASFCDQCGKTVSAVPSPADKAAAKEAVKEMVKDGVSGVFSQKTADQIQSSWKNFCFDEKAVALGAAAAVIGFFLPLLETSYGKGDINGIEAADEGSKIAYLLPLLGALALFLIFFGHQKNLAQKILNCRWLLMIGMFLATLGFVAASLVESLTESLGGLAGGEIGIGWWMISWGGVAIVFGAVRLQKRLLDMMAAQK